MNKKKKKKGLWLMALLLMALSAGCGKKEEAPLPDPAKEEALEETVKTTIYYGNAQADGFEQKETELVLTPQNLLDELSRVNVVSIDTVAGSFTDTQGHLTLDLTGGFSQYLNMMGTSGEYIVVGGLVNTFLTAYDGEDILLTVDGKTLESGHAVYDKPLTFFENDGGAAQKPEDQKEGEKDGGAQQAASVGYRLTEESSREGSLEIYYPQFTGMSDADLQKKWNRALMELTVTAAKETDAAYDAYTVDYDIMECDAEFVSFVFRRETTSGGRVDKDAFAVSFDMTAGKNVRFADFPDAMEEAAKALAAGGYYKILSDDVDREEFDEYMKKTSPTAEEYKEEFLQYDFDLDDPDREPYGTTYIRDGKLVIIMDVPTAAGKTLDIDTGIKVR